MFLINVSLLSVFFFARDFKEGSRLHDRRWYDHIESFPSSERVLARTWKTR